MIKPRWVLGVAILAASAVPAAARADRFANAEITSTKVAGSVWMLEPAERWIETLYRAD